MTIRSRGIVFGRLPGPLRNLDSRQDRDKANSAGHPLGSDPLESGGSKIVIPEPRAVYEHLQYGVQLYRCSHPPFHNGSVDHQRVRQGILYNCPLPAILAAMAYTGTYVRIKIVEKKGTAYSEQGNGKIKVDRYFEIELPGRKIKKGSKKIRVTDFFWGSGACKFQYSHCKPLNTTTPEKELWVALAEKAFVRTNAGNTFERLNDPDNETKRGPDIYEYFQTLTGQEAKWVEIAKTSDADLRKLIKKAKQLPMITNLPADNANQAHAYMLEGMDPFVTDEVALYDALSGNGISLSLKGFKEQYQFIFHE